MTDDADLPPLNTVTETAVVWAVTPHGAGWVGICSDHGTINVWAHPLGAAYDVLGHIATHHPRMSP